MDFPRQTRGKRAGRTCKIQESPRGAPGGQGRGNRGHQSMEIPGGQAEQVHAQESRVTRDIQTVTDSLQGRAFAQKVGKGGRGRMA